MFGRYDTFVFGTVIIVLASTRAAKAELLVNVSVAVEQQQSGDYEYRYRIENHAASSGSVAVVGIEKAVDAVVSPVTAPPLWVLDVGPSSNVFGWESPPDPSTLLAAGTTTTFAIKSIFAPDLRNYLLIGRDDTTLMVLTSQGQIEAPSIAIPEPSTSWMLGALCFFLPHLTKCNRLRH